MANRSGGMPSQAKPNIIMLDVYPNTDKYKYSDIISVSAKTTRGWINE